MLERPTNPFIWYDSRDVSYSHILVDPNQDCFLLQCISYNGVPSPIYTWKTNEKRLDSKLCDEINQTVVSNSDKSFSSIMIHPSEVRDRQWIECSISNRALKLESGQHSLNTKVQIRFQSKL